MIFAVYLGVKMARREERAKEILDKFVTADTGIKYVHNFKDPVDYITQNRVTVRYKSKIPGYIFIEMDKEFVDNNTDEHRKEEIPAITWHFLKSKLFAFNIDILDYHIKDHELREYFEVEEVMREKTMDETTVVISIDKETEELIEIAEKEELEPTHTLGNRFIDIFCVAVQKAKSLLSTKEGRTRLNIPRRLWKEAYSLFDPFGVKNKDAFKSNHTYLPFLINAIQGSV